MKPFLLMSSASHKPIWFRQSLNMVIEKIIFHELIFSMTEGNLSLQVSSQSLSIKIREFSTLQVRIVKDNQNRKMIGFKDFKNTLEKHWMYLYFLRIVPQWVISIFKHLISLVNLTRCESVKGLRCSAMSRISRTSHMKSMTGWAEKIGKIDQNMQYV